MDRMDLVRPAVVANGSEAGASIFTAAATQIGKNATHEERRGRLSVTVTQSVRSTGKMTAAQNCGCDSIRGEAKQAASSISRELLSCSSTLVKCAEGGKGKSCQIRMKVG